MAGQLASFSVPSWNSGTNAATGVATTPNAIAATLRASARLRSGRTFGALSITHPVKYREPFEPLVPGVDFVRLNDLADLEAKFTDEVCAVIIEPIQGEAEFIP